MYHFMNFEAQNNTLNSTFCRNTENSILSEIRVYYFKRYKQIEINLQ